MMNLNALKIDPEFQGKIPPLNFEEEQQLEQNILSIYNGAGRVHSLPCKR